MEYTQKEIKDIYKRNYEKYIKKYTYIFSKYHNVSLISLKSEANEIFFNCIKMYTYNHISFDNFFRYQLVKYLNHYIYKEYIRKSKENLMKTKLEVRYENIFNFNIITLPKNGLNNLNTETKKIINQILDFCTQPNFMELLEPYLKIKKQKKLKPSAYIITKYIKDKYGYSRYKIEKAITQIKILLKEDAI